MLANSGGGGIQAYSALKEGGYTNFNAFLCGWRNYRGQFESQNEYTGFWTSTKKDDGIAWYGFLSTVMGENANIYHDDMKLGLSVRLVKD